MQAFMTFITNNYWIFLILAAVCGIAIVGYNVEGKKEKAFDAAEKIEEQTINSVSEQNKPVENPNDNIIIG